MEFIDTHTHLSDEAFENGGDDMVRKAIEAGVVMMILPGTSLDEMGAMKSLAARFPENLRMFVGLHPTELTDNPDGAIAVVRRELESCIRYVGV